jgi:hypothetical protein
VWLIRLTKTLTDALPRALDCNRDATGQFPGLEIALEWLAPRMHLITSRKHRAPLLRLGTPEKAKLIIINNFGGDAIPLPDATVWEKSNGFIDVEALAAC